LTGTTAELGHYENTNQPFKLHGRLSIYNGNPPFRIWIVGTNRILGVKGGDLVPAEMPEKLKAIMTLDTKIYADFHITPLTKYVKGVMQIVRIDAVENLVIYRGGKFVAKRKQL
jgi:hypothetical protein